MKRIFTAFLVILFAVFQLSAQEWLVYPMDVLPEDTGDPFDWSSLADNSPGVDYYHEIIADPLDASNNLLRFGHPGDSKTMYRWQMGAVPSDTSLTIVLRMKGDEVDFDRLLDVNIRNGKWREEIRVAYDGMVTIKNAPDDGSVALFEGSVPGRVHGWHLYRIVLDVDTITVYVDEDPVPVTKGVCGRADTQTYVKIGDGSGDEIGSILDWIVVDTSGAYAPGEGAALPAELNASSEKNIILVTSATHYDPDDAQYAFLMRNGFNVERFYPGLLSEAGQDTIDKLNAADLVIVGRSCSSSEFDNEDKTPWNDLTATVVFNSQWIARSNRVNLIKSGSSAYHKNDGPAVEYAQVLEPGDPIFSGVTLVGDSMAWMLPPHDYIIGADSTTNGEMLARVGDAPLIVRWDAGVAYYEGSTDTCRGDRVYFGFGNDDIGATRPGPDETANFFPLTRAAKAVYLAEICRILGIPVQEPVFGAEDVRVMMYTDYEADIEERGQMDDIEQTRWLVNQGFYVTKYLAGPDISALDLDDDPDTTESALAKMNMSVDVVIAGRSNNSGGFQSPKDTIWNSLTVPLIINSQWAARSNKIGMINSTSSWHKDTEYPVAYANVQLPDDPVFTGVALTGDSVAWMLAPHDFVGGLDAETNGDILAGSNLENSPLVVRWAAGTEYFPGAGTAKTPAGPRYYFGFGNDHLRDTGPHKWTNDFPLTKAGKQAYLNAICLMGGIEVAQLPTAVTTAADEVVTFVTDYEADQENNGYWDDQVQIDWLMKNGVHVNVFHPGPSMAEASEDTLAILNASELIIAGRSNNSGYFQSPSDTIWNSLTAPLIINSPWAARSNKIGMINSTSSFHKNTEYPEAYAHAVDPADPLFTGVTLAGDSVGWTYVPHDFVGGLDAETNGTIHAGSTLENAPLIVTWEAGTEYFPGAGTAKTPAGPRAYVGFGNDNLRDNGPNYRPYDFNLTEDGQQIYMNMISMMLGAKMSTAITVTANTYLDSLTYSVEGATMEPAFNRDVTEYDLWLPEGVSAVLLKAYPNNILAWTIGDSAVMDITDSIKIAVHVIAESWAEKIYNVNIHAFEEVGIEDEAEVSSAGIRLYPNPASGILYLESDAEIARVTVFNVVGKMVIDEAGLLDRRIQLNVGELTPGLYMIRVDQDDHSTMTKFLKR